MKPVEIFKSEDFGTDRPYAPETMAQYTNRLANEWLEANTEVRYGKKYTRHDNESYESLDGVRLHHHEFSRRCFPAEPLEAEKVEKHCCKALMEIIGDAKYCIECGDKL